MYKDNYLYTHFKFELDEITYLNDKITMLIILL